MFHGIYQLSFIYFTYSIKICPCVPISWNPQFFLNIYIDCLSSRRLLYTVRSINETFKSKLIYETQKGSVSRIPVMRRYQNNTIGSVFALYYLNCCRCGYFRCVKAENAVITKEISSSSSSPSLLNKYSTEQRKNKKQQLWS